MKILVEFFSCCLPFGKPFVFRMVPPFHVSQHVFYGFLL